MYKDEKTNVCFFRYLAKEMSGPGKRGVNVWWGQQETRKTGLPVWRKSFGGGGGSGGSGGSGGGGGSGGSFGSGGSKSHSNEHKGSGGSVYAVLSSSNNSNNSSSSNSSNHSSGGGWIDKYGLKLPPYSPLAVAVKGHQPMVCKGVFSPCKARCVFIAVFIAVVFILYMLVVLVVLQLPTPIMIRTDRLGSL